MPSQRLPIPTSWADTEQGTRTNSTDSGLSQSRVQFDNESQEHHTTTGEGLLQPGGAYEHHHVGNNLRHRRSSMSIRIHSLRQAGGVNSIDNFARSWQRAAGFHEIRPVRPSFQYAEPNDEHDYHRRSTDATARDPRSLLREAFAEGGRRGSDNVVEDDTSLAPGASTSRTQSSTPAEHQPLLHSRISERHEGTSFSVDPSLASAFGGSYGSTWGSLGSRVNEPAMRHAGRLFRDQQLKGVTPPDKEREPLLVKTVQEDDGRVVNVVVGQSTLPQTIFNSVNVLIGIGLLSLPLALQYSGLIPGLMFLFFAAASTMYTAKLLAKCLDVDSSLVTFADLAYVSFGPRARIATGILFSLELIATCVALVVLFADSLQALTSSSLGLTEWKVICGLALLPLAFAPLSFLSITSILGILCCFGIVLVVFIDGMIKKEQPGSLRSPANIHLFPDNLGTLPLSFGLLMAPWGGHSVFPNIYRDMRHPYKYRKAVDITYASTFILDLFLAVIGLLMFGDGVKDEITRNVLTTKGYPETLGVFIVVCVAIIPLTKVPLNARPIVSTLEIFLGLDSRAMSGAGESMNGLSSLSRGLLKATVRVGCVAIFVVLAILVPDFDRIMSLLGAVACFTICIILPAAFHLKLFGKELSRWQKTLDWSLIVISTIFALVSTAFNFVPKDRLGLA